MRVLSLINYGVAILFTVCYAYQFIYILVPWIVKRRKEQIPPAANRFAVLICARNEAEVVGDLIRSIRAQTYPAHLITTFVMADNCTDNTADVAAKAGAKVYTRKNQQFVGKGYALQTLMEQIQQDYPEGFDGYFVFDADNILTKDYIEQMNRTFSQGHSIVTSYRNSKNYGSNWISAGYALWFLRESRYLNHARYLLGTSCAVSGTGFLFSREIAQEMEGWPFHMLTEDIEFSIYHITKGRKIAFCPDAQFYDEQPISFAQSWRQRMRWSRGYLQVFGGYGKKLVAGVFRGSFSCVDMCMTIMPAFILSTAALISNVTLGIWGAFAGEDVMVAVKSISVSLLSMYFLLFFIGGITTITEWKRIHTTTGRKIRYLFTFPLFMETYVPISVASLFFRTTWKPIRHTMSAQKLYQQGVVEVVEGICTD